jgi:deoxycytidine triphosphate deaminase
MAVIALTTLGPAASVVRSNDLFDRNKTAILILSGDDSQLGSDATDCNATYDLRVGEKFRDYRSFDYEDLVDSEEIRLLAGNAVIIQTEEFVKFPITRFGQIFPKVSLLQKGLANTPSKVDPGYEGHLLITLFNQGKTTVPLHRYDKFCSLHVLDMAGEVRPYDKPGKQISGVQRSTGWVRRVRDAIEAHVATAIVTQTVVMFASLIIATLAFIFGVRK